MRRSGRKLTAVVKSVEHMMREEETAGKRHLELVQNDIAEGTERLLK